MYERSLGFATNERIKTKIEYIKKLKEIKTGSGKLDTYTTKTGSTASGSTELENKKEELQKIA
jgi:hypothetical protein